MRSFIKKDLLLFWRDRKELITVLVLPILLVVVLNFAFAGLLGNDKESSMNLQLGVVNQDDDKDAKAQLKEKLIEEASFSEAEATRLMEQVYVNPIQMILDYLGSRDLKGWVTVHELKENEAVEKVKAGDLDGILIIPKGFTADSLYAAFVKEPPTTSLKYKMEKETNNNRTLYNIIHGFIDNLNFQFALQRIEGAEDAEVMLPKGGFEEVGSVKSFTLTQYFTISMGALFALFLAATVGTKTGVEIRQQVFNRILLTNSHPMLFLIGKMISTFCLVWLQIMFVFMMSHFIFNVFPDRSITFWMGIMGIVTLLSLSIAGLAAVFTTISLRMANVDAANGIFMLVILLLGVLGGNFVPIYVLPDWLQRMGEWTPNGLSLVIFTEWIKFEEFSSIASSCVLLVGFFLLCTLIASALYPNRGKA